MFSYSHSYYIAEPMVEVFKTNVDRYQDAEELLQRLNARFPDYKMNFDIEDCDRILRVQSNDDEVLPAGQIMAVVHSAGFACSVLDG